MCSSDLPQAKVYFVGSGPPPALRAAAGPKIIVTGTVADVRPYLQFARAVIAPLHIARGVQNKVLEAMAMAKAVVAAPASLASHAADDTRVYAFKAFLGLRHRCVARPDTVALQDLTPEQARR